MRRKGDLESPNSQQQQQGVTPKDYHPPSSNHLRITFQSSLSSKNMATNGLHHSAPIISMIKAHNSGTSLHDDFSIIPSDSTGSPSNEHPAASPMTPTSNITESSTDYNCSGCLLVFAETSSRISTHCSFFADNSVPVVPESIWHHHICKYRHQQNSLYESAAPQNQYIPDTTRPTQFHSPTMQSVIMQDSSMFNAAHAHKDKHTTEYYYH